MQALQPMPSLDALPYWAGLQAGRLLIQRCRACGQHRHYPRPMCPACQSFELDWVPISGRGAVHSWTVVHQSALPGLADQLPFTLVTIDLPEGVRLLARMPGDAGACLQAGAAIQVTAGTDTTGAPLVQCHRD